MNSYNTKHLKNIVRAVRNSLTDDLRKPIYRGKECALAGHCYVASEALYHLLGGKDSGWVPQNIQHEGGPHWYLKHKFSGAILDPTAEQFDTPVPYENGRGKGFLTKQPSKRAQAVLDRVAANGLDVAKSEKDELSKTKPGMTFPKLGVPDNRRETPIVNDTQSHQNKARLLANKGIKAQVHQARLDPSDIMRHRMKGASLSEAKDAAYRDAHERIYGDPSIRRELNTHFANQLLRPGTMGVSGSDASSTLSFSRGDQLRSGLGGVKSPGATQLHEDLHNIFSRVSAKYGEEGRRNLAVNMLDWLKISDPDAYHALRTHTMVNRPDSAVLTDYSKPHHYHGFNEEEHITTLLNYLNDPDFRNRYQSELFGTVQAVQAHDQELKRAYRVLTEYAKQAGPLAVLRPEHRRRAEWNQIDRQADQERQAGSAVMKSEGVKVACSIAVFNSEGFLLMGLRNDSGRWTLPGGKADAGELPEECARRELLEEAGLEINRLQFLGKGAGGKNGDWKIYSFRAESDDKPDASQDPDEEVDEWEWIDVRTGLPDEIARNLHNHGQDVTLQLLGLQKADEAVLEKSWKHALIGAVAAAGMAGSPAHAADPAPAQQPNQHVVEAAKWTPKGLADGLKPIAYLESSNGKNTHHAPNSKGAFHSAYGAVGLKADTAHETYKRTPWLQKTFPGLDDPQKFLQEFKTNFALYNHVASAHWNHLRKLFGGDRLKAAYAWRWGPHAVKRDGPEVRANDPYVKAYSKLWAKQSGQVFSASLKNPLSKSEVEDWLAKADARYLRTSDREVSLPVMGTPERERWDARYMQALQDKYGAGVGKTLKPLQVPIDKVASGTNAAVNQTRLKFYRRVAQKDQLPPIIVQRHGNAFHVLDGNHRHEAARNVGLSHIQGFEMLDEKPTLINAGIPSHLNLYNLNEDPKGLLEPKVRQTEYGQFIEPVEFKDVEKKIKRLGFHGYHGHSRDPNAYVTFSGKTAALPAPEDRKKRS